MVKELSKSEKQQQELRKIHSGDLSGLGDFLNENMGLCVYFSKQYLPLVQPTWELDDLINESFFGLRTAALKYDPDNKVGAAFSTYAAFWIKQTIRRFIGNHGSTIRIPIHTLDDFSKVKRELSTGLGLDDACENKDIDPEDYYRICSLVNLISYNQKTSNEEAGDSDTEMVDFISSETSISAEDICINDSTIDECSSIMKKYLSDKEYEVLSRRLGLFESSPETLQIVSENIGLSRERVRQIEETALKKLQIPFTAIKEGKI